MLQNATLLIILQINMLPFEIENDFANLGILFSKVLVLSILLVDYPLISIIGTLLEMNSKSYKISK